MPAPLMAGTILLEVLQWAARERDCPLDERNALCILRSGRTPEGVAVGAGAPLPMERDDVRV